MSPQPRHINLDEQAVTGSCTTVIIADAAVTSPKLAAGAVNGNALGVNSVSASKLASDVYGNGLVANGITSAIDINVDNITLQIVTDVLKTKQIILENFVSDPIAGSAGRLIWNTTSSQVKVDNGVSFTTITGGGSGANTALSNLITTSINTDLLPNANATLNLGNSGLTWGTVFTRELTTDLSALTVTNNLDVLGHIGLESTFALFFNGLGDVNWRIGRNLNAFSYNTITTSSLDVVVDGGSGQGFAVGAIGGTSYFELDETGNAFLRYNTTVGGTLSVSGLQLTTSPTNGYVLTSDGAGNGTWQQATGGHIIDDEGTPLPQRAVLNFVGSGVTVTDGGTETTVSIPSGSGSVYAKDLLTVTNPISDHTILLSNTPISNSEIVSLNGLILRIGVSNDYTISGNTVTINAGILLTVGDEFMIVYAF